MHNYQGVFALLVSMAFPACAGSSVMATPQSESTSKEEREEASINSIPLPKSWETFGHEQWLGELGIRACNAQGEASEQRLKNTIELDKGIHLLTLTCEFGAYQDAFYVYSVDPAEETVKRVVLEKPEINGASGEGELVRGSLYIDEDGESLALLNLSSAAGACGWKALYPLTSVRSGGVVAARVVFADNDCYNGVTVEDWPIFEEPKSAQ